MSKIVAWGGTNGTFVGRFGPLNAGDQITMTDDEYAAVASDSRFGVVPTAADSKLADGPTVLTKTVGYTILAADRVIRSNHSAPATHTLPASPTVGEIHEIVDVSAAGAATNNT